MEINLFSTFDYLDYIVGQTSNANSKFWRRKEVIDIRCRAFVMKTIATNRDDIAKANTKNINFRFFLIFFLNYFPSNCPWNVSHRRYLSHLYFVRRIWVLMICICVFFSPISARSTSQFIGNCSQRKSSGDIMEPAIAGQFFIIQITRKFYSNSALFAFIWFKIRLCISFNRFWASPMDLRQTGRSQSRETVNCSIRCEIWCRVPCTKCRRTPFSIIGNHWPTPAATSQRVSRIRAIGTNLHKPQSHSNI